MNINRREFLASIGSVYIASLFLSNQVFARMTFDPGWRLTLTHRDYAARTSDWFYFHNATATQQSNLQLIRVVDCGSTSRVEQFALTFRSERQAPAIPSGTYEIAGEPFRLYVKHTHEFDGRQYYRAELALLR